MTQQLALKSLTTRLSQIRPEQVMGRVNGVDGGVVRVRGLEKVARLGDRATITNRDHTKVQCEVVQLSDAHVVLLPDSELEGVSLGDPVTLSRGGRIAPSDSWIGRLIDPDGNPLDGRPLAAGATTRSLRASPPAPAQRRALGPRLATGHLTFDTVLPIVRGQRIGLFAGSGVGKSSLMGRLSQRMEADVVVIALIGERGREVRHFVDETLGPEGLARSVVVAATSDQSPLVRRRCAWTAMTIAEHFRDAGKSVLLVADSITRFAEAHREVAIAAGEAPVLRGYPPSTAHLIMSLCERAGPGMGRQGDITAVFSVLVPGSDMDEPIADILRGVLDGHVVLDRDIAERGRFPAVDVLRSVSRSLPAAATDSENEVLATVRKHLSVYAKNRVMISAGLYTSGADANIDAAIDVWSELDAALGMQHDKGISHSFDHLKLILRRGGRGVNVGSKRPHMA
ncbi:FliI/YscN family ATPase [uncultured Tateyamaria sp.]|uniref:FliI/YscN family ATPase n=1 Tax=Tateyamaria sp. 1078 TaxID=3417464 RepID=UPI002617A880|nr:FliI/YscN family ATPase [uncultured Tateyamaria sp.]